MNLTIIIIIVMLFILGVLLILEWWLTLIDKCNHILPYGLVGGLIITVTAILLCVINEQPKAIDVYRNKTTLEITYKDGIAIDSVVVFKDKEK